MRTVLVFFLFYVLVFAVSAAAVIGLGADIVTGLTASIATLGEHRTRVLASGPAVVLCRSASAEQGSF